MAKRKRREAPMELQKLGGEEALASTIRTLYWDGVQSIRTELQDYWLNHAYLHGYQWLYWSETTGSLAERPRDPERIRATVNRIWPNTRTIISSLMQRPLVFEVPATAADDSHIRGARLAETICQQVAHDHMWEELRENLYYAVWKGGTAAICIDWDDDAESSIADVPGSARTKGDTYEEHLNITQFVVEPGSRYPEKARWWIKSVALPPEEVQKMFDLEDVPPADATAGLSPFNRKLMSFDRGGEPEDTKLTAVFTYYERPSDENKKGKVCTVVDNNVVFEGDWPFPFKDRLNLVVIRETLRENRWTGDTVLTSVRPIQTLLNATESSVAEHMKNAGNARLMIPLSSIEMMRNFTDLPGEALPYNDSMPVKPDYLSPPVMPQWWIERPTRLMQHIDDLMGVQDVTRGAAPANIESGFGLTILAERGDTPLNRLAAETSGGFGRLASLMLAMYESKAEGKRRSMVRVPGNSPIDITWTGEELRGQTTAYVPLDAIMPRSRAAQMEMAKDMLAAGLIEDTPTFLAIAEVPGYRDILQVTSPDTDKARRENSMFGLGRQSVPDDFDKHDVHIREHNNYRKTPDYQLLTDEERQMVDEHIEAHEVLAAKEVGKARMRTEMDPALGMAPTAAEGPQLEPLALPPAGGTGGAAPPGESGIPTAAQGALEGVTDPMAANPDGAVAEIMQMMSQSPGPVG